jgi:mannose-6-phosphate isomerase-like protein (cupin superfamily)
VTLAKANNLDLRGRRVVSGLDENGKSTIILDEPTSARTATKAFVLCDIWRTDSLPPRLDAPDILNPGDVLLEPPDNGMVVRVSIVPPDEAWESDADYAEAMDAVGYSDSSSDGKAKDDGPGWHTTDTIDILTIISGELTAILETTETVLTAGDTFVQRGVKHAWANRGDEPVIAVAMMMSAER